VGAKRREAIGDLPGVVVQIFKRIAGHAIDESTLHGQLVDHAPPIVADLAPLGEQLWTNVKEIGQCRVDESLRFGKLPNVTRCWEHEIIHETRRRALRHGLSHIRAVVIEHCVRQFVVVCTHARSPCCRGGGHLVVFFLCGLVNHIVTAFKCARQHHQQRANHAHTSLFTAATYAERSACLDEHEFL
jgi:hypothetical protein